MTNDEAVRVLRDFIEEERNAIFYAMTRGNNYDIGLAKERMTEILAATENAGGWLDISSAPRDGTEVLVSALGDISIAIFLERDWFCRADAMMVEDLRGDYKKVYPESWQPLPISPAPERK